VRRISLRDTKTSLSRRRRTSVATPRTTRGATPSRLLCWKMSISGGGVGVLLFPFYVRACSPTRASSKRNPTSERSLKSVLFSRLFRSLHRRCLFLVSSHPSQTEVRVRVSEASSVFGENASSFAINRGKKNTRENAFSFFFASRRSHERISKILCIVTLHFLYLTF